MQDYFVDQFEQPLEPGQLYAIRSLNQPATRAAVCELVAMIRGTAHWRVATLGAAAPAHNGPQIERWTMDATTAGQVTFTHVDDQWREMVALPDSVRTRETIKARRKLARIAKQARLLRVRQTRLIQAANKALKAEGKTDVEDLTTSWVCDSHSHVSISDLLELFRQQMEG